MKTIFGRKHYLKVSPLSRYALKLSSQTNNNTDTSYAHAVPSKPSASLCNVYKYYKIINVSCYVFIPISTLLQQTLNVLVNSAE